MQYEFSAVAVPVVANTAKTVLELGTTGAKSIKIVEWWVSFDGISSVAIPVRVEIGRFSAAVTTATTGTASEVDTRGEANVTVVKHTTTTEGAGTAEAGIKTILVHPQGGLYIQSPLGREQTITTSSFWRLRCFIPSGQTTVNATAGVQWEE